MTSIPTSKTAPSPNKAQPINLASAIAAPIFKGVLSQTFGSTANPSKPATESSTPPRSTIAKAPNLPPRKVFDNQANPTPVKFGGKQDDATTTAIADAAAAKKKQELAENDGFAPVGKGGKAKANPNAAAAASNPAVSNVSSNSGHFARDNKGTTSVAGGGPGVTLSADTVDGQNVELLETMMRGIAINAVHNMKALNLGPNPPAVMGVLLAKGEVKAGSGDARQGWQVYIHSSVKGDPPGGPRAQAELHPALKERIQRAGLVHHFSSMCAEMGLLSNYFYDNLDLVKAPGPLKPLGESVYMMTYVAGNHPARDGEETKDGTGYYLIPCAHSPEKCGARKNHFGEHGCIDVLKLLGIQPIGRGNPSEQDAIVIKEQTAREQGSATAGPAAGPQAGSGQGASPRTRTPASTGRGSNPGTTAAGPQGVSPRTPPAGNQSTSSTHNKTTIAKG